MSPEKPHAQPISPDELAALQREQFPSEVIETFNELLAENTVEGYATLMQKDILERLVSKGVERALVFKRGWLNVEEMYREAGWEVKYDKPGWDEDYDPYFRFSRRK